MRPRELFQLAPEGILREKLEIEGPWIVLRFVMGATLGTREGFLIHPALGDDTVDDH
jgi:hypothetical protein